MIDTTYWEKGIMRLCGIDEAGRGPLAGPLVVAAVILHPFQVLEGVGDSKKISAKKRAHLAEVIKQEALAYHIDVVDVKTIDELNIYQATKASMQRLVDTLKPDFTLTDAMPLAVDTPHEAIIKGDQKSLAIGAASILAKVTRDQWMEELAQTYPLYGFEKHKGYPTKAHIKALKEHGATDFHRRSFAPVRDVLKPGLTRFDENEE